MPAATELKKQLSAAAAEGLLSHAVLIEGEQGVGKRELALWFCKALLCKNQNPPCGHCSVCKKIDGGNHPDVEIYDGSGGARSFHIESVREIKDSLWLAPNESDIKIYVLLEIQNMTAEAQNALLKSLEEPPEHARFIMTCQNSGMLLDTVISRCTVYKLEPFSDGECAVRLKSALPEISDEDAALLAAAYAGNLGRASSAFQEGRLPLAQLAAKTPELLRGAKSYDLAAGLAAAAGDRAALCEYIEIFGNITARCGINFAAGKPAPLNLKIKPAQAVKIMEILNRGKEAALQNCMPELIQSWLCAQLSAVLGGSL